VKKTFAALVAVYMLAEQIDDEKLTQTLEGTPDLPQWRDVRLILTSELRRREEVRNLLGSEESAEDAA
jgi:hypothetical protein